MAYSKRSSKPTDKAAAFKKAAGEGRQDKPKKFFKSGEGGKAVDVVIDAGIVTPTMGLTELYKAHGEKQIVKKLSKFNQNSLKVYFNAQKKEKVLTVNRDVVESDKTFKLEEEEDVEEFSEYKKPPPSNTKNKSGTSDDATGWMPTMVME